MTLCSDARPHSLALLDPPPPSPVRTQVQIQDHRFTMNILSSVLAFLEDENEVMTREGIVHII